MSSDAPVARLPIPSVPQFTVWMTVEGRDTPLYSVQESPNKTICYVESKTGQHFAIGFADTRKTRPYGYTADLWGTKSHLRGYPIRADRRYPSETIGATRVSSTTERPLIFGEVSTTSDEGLACTDETIFKNLGSLTLKIRRWSSRQVRHGTRNNQKSLEAPLIHEDSKKANFSHTTSFGAEQNARIRKKPPHTYNYIDLPGRPFHVFEFRYRSRAILEMENLIPDADLSLPIAGPSHSGSNLSNASFNSGPRSESTANAQPQAPIIISDDEEDEEAVPEAELSRLQDELAELERQSRMIRGGSTSSGLKREGEGEGVAGTKGKKKVKLEKGGNGGTSGGGMSKGKGKEKEKEVLVLSDSD